MYITYKLGTTAVVLSFYAAHVQITPNKPVALTQFPTLNVGMYGNTYSMRYIWDFVSSWEYVDFVSSRFML